MAIDNKPAKIVSVVDVGITIRDKKLFIERWPLVIPLPWSFWHLNRWRSHVFPRDLADNVMQAIQASTTFVISLDGEPGCIGDMGLGKHDVLGF